MFRIVSTLAAFAVLACTITAPASAAVRIDAALELALPDFVPELQKHTIFVLNERAEWPVASTKAGLPF